jgi:hypothetical protein
MGTRRTTATSGGGGERGRLTTTTTTKKVMAMRMMPLEGPTVSERAAKMTEIGIRGGTANIERTTGIGATGTETIPNARAGETEGATTARATMTVAIGGITIGGGTEARVEGDLRTVSMRISTAIATAGKARDVQTPVTTTTTIAATTTTTAATIITEANPAAIGAACLPRRRGFP